MNSTDLKVLDSVIVTLQSGGKIIAHALLTNSFYYDRIKVSIEGTDDMIESVNRNFLCPLRRPSMPDRTTFISDLFNELDTLLSFCLSLTKPTCSTTRSPKCSTEC